MPAMQPEKSASQYPSHTFSSSRTIRRVHELLKEQYGSRKPTPRDPLDGLVLIILSQATNDINCDRAFQSLKNHFPTWDDVLEATDDEVADAIRSGGLANQKAKRIRQLLAAIKADRGSLDLNWMHRASAAECEDYLEKFHGVGPKTIACVLVFFLGKPAFPVDTHVHRVTKRLGWIRPQAGADEAHKVFRDLVPDDDKLDLHVNLISHGRAICRAPGNGGPKCGACLIRRHCAFGKIVKLSKEEVEAQGQSTFHGTDFFVTVE